MDLVPAVPRPGLSGPFTPAIAAAAGVGRASLERLHRDGRIVRLLCGVYVDAQVPLTSRVRARAVALVVGRRQVVVDRTAAWVHGAELLTVPADAPVPLDLHGRRRYVGGHVPFARTDLGELEGITCTTPVRTALDVGRHLAPERALVALDGLLRAGTLRHPELIAASALCHGLPGAGQLRELAARADGRAAEAAESVLRLRWYDARLPTPTPSVRVAGTRLALGLGVQRFGVVLSGQATPAELRGCSRAGWRVLVVARSRVLAEDPAAVIGHLEREFHQHLLAEAG
ncbi:MAG: hypothetical protein JWR52_2952 [Marmoricola sp.]|nr:hypothetical protein [Marmoricola sp.]